MISLKIVEVKPFMGKLFSSNIFDDFYLKEMEIQTFTNFHITGNFNDNFYSQEELELREKQTLWSDLKAVAFSIIKGNKTPISMKLIIQLPNRKTEDLVQKLAGRIQSNEVGGLFINIRFEKGVLHIISGTAIKTFTLDKTLEQEWDLETKNILKEQGILFEEI